MTLHTAKLHFSIKEYIMAFKMLQNLDHKIMDNYYQIESRQAKEVLTTKPLEDRDFQFA